MVLASFHGVNTPTWPNVAPNTMSLGTELEEVGDRKGGTQGAFPRAPSHREASKEKSLCPLHSQHITNVPPPET